MTGNEKVVVAISRPKDEADAKGNEHTFIAHASDFSNPRAVGRSVQKFEAAHAIPSSDGQYLLLALIRGSFQRFDILANKQHDYSLDKG